MDSYGQDTKLKMGMVQSDTFHLSTTPWRMQGMAAWQNATAKQLIVFLLGL